MTSLMRVLVIGGTGMLGHKVWQEFRRRFDCQVTVRDARLYRSTGLFSDDRVIDGVHSEHFETVVHACDVAAPSVIVNCVGVVKQLKSAHEPLPSIEINALFPHRLAAYARRVGARLIHISTDCVFAGTRGNYSEGDEPDAQDLYGRTKLLGEVSGPGCLTLRTSMVGRELSSTTGLVEWFLGHRDGRVKGYTHARFSGLTTAALAAALADIVERHPALEGLYHVASEPISKYDLLHRLNQVLCARVQIEASDEMQVDRTLDGSRFAAATGLRFTWAGMLDAMAKDETPYEQWRESRV
jgi:dTDP-4-dehydrorhamnose reductase